MVVEKTLNDIENLLTKKKRPDAQRLLDSLKTMPKNKCQAMKFYYLQACCVFQQIETRVFIKGSLNSNLDLNDILKTLDTAKSFCQQAIFKMDGSNAESLYGNIHEKQKLILKLKADLCWDYSQFNFDQLYTLDEYKYYKHNASMSKKYYGEYFIFLRTSGLLNQNQKDKVILDRKKSFQGCEDHILAIEELIQQSSEKSNEQPNKKKKTIEEGNDETAINTLFSVKKSPDNPLILNIYFQSEFPKRKARNKIDIFNNRYREIGIQFQKLTEKLSQQQSRSTISPFINDLDGLFDRCETLRIDITQYKELANLDKEIFLMQVDVRATQANDCWNSFEKNDSKDNSEHKLRKLNRAHGYYEKYYALVSDSKCPLKKAEKDQLKSKTKVDIEECIKEIAKLIKSDKKENLSTEKHSIETDEDAINILNSLSVVEISNSEFKFFQTVKDKRSNISLKENPTIQPQI